MTDIAQGGILGREPIQTVRVSIPPILGPRWAALAMEQVQDRMASAKVRMRVRVRELSGTMRG